MTDFLNEITVVVNCEQNQMSLSCTLPGNKLLLIKLIRQYIDEDLIIAESIATNVIKDRMFHINTTPDKSEELMGMLESIECKKINK